MIEPACPGVNARPLGLAKRPCGFRPTPARIDRMSYDLSYDATTSLLEQAGISFGPSEAHGILAGLACAGLSDDEAALSALGDPGDFPEFLEYIEAARTQIAQSLYDADLSFEPLLPDDDVPPVQRSRALTQWCRGFITGFTFHGNDDSADETAGATEEALADIRDMATAEGTVGEEDLVELVEYLRVSIQLIYEERQA